MKFEYTLFFQVLLQLRNSLLRIAFRLIEQSDEAAADDGTGGVGAGGIEGLLVADAEAHHAGIAQLQGFYLLEVGLLGVVEVFLRTGGGSAGHHVDETIGVGIDFADAGFAGFGGDEHDDADVVLQGDGLVAGFIIAEGEVGDDDAIDATLGTFLAEGLEAELHDGVEIAHKDEGDADVAADVSQLLEEKAEGHAVAQGTGGSILDDDAVGHGVAERDADFDHLHAVAFEGADDVGSTVEGGTAGAEIDGQQVLGAVLEKLVNAVQHKIYDFKFIISFRKVSIRSTSLMPGADSKRLLRSMPAKRG